MASARTINSAKRPAIGDEATEEAFNILEARLNGVESLVRPGEKAVGYDDTFVKNLIKRLNRELEDHSHRQEVAPVPPPVTGVSAYFAVSNPSDTEFAVGAGRVIHGTGSEAIPAVGATTIASDGLHYVYIKMYESSGWAYSILSSTIYPIQTDAFEMVTLGILTMAGGIITNVAQVQFGEISSSRIWD